MSFGHGGVDDISLMDMPTIIASPTSKGGGPPIPGDHPHQEHRRVNCETR